MKKKLIAGNWKMNGGLAANEALVSGSSVDTDPAVLAAKARVDAARLDVERTVIRAPVAGVVTHRQVQLGQRVAQGTPIMTIVPINQLYVDANFKESQTRAMAIGQPATIRVDALGGTGLTGHVQNIAPAAGSEFAVIKSDNATGNFVKVAQRIAVRIGVDPGQAAARRLRPGMSVEVSVDTRAKGQ